MMNKLTIKDVNLSNKRVIMRVDFNVPIKDGEISDCTRITEELPSINYIINSGASLVIMSHLGKPHGKFSKELSLKPCAEALEKMIRRPVKLAPGCIGDEVENFISEASSNEVIMLENLRFHTGEEHPDDQFVAKLAKLGDIYVNDAFGTCHRNHSSIVPITKFFNGKSLAGFLVEKELLYLQKVLFNKEKPFYAIIGGKKISSKLGVIKSLIKKIDGLFIGGGMAFTFFKSQGLPIGKSIYEDNCISVARDIVQECSDRNIEIFLPTDIVAAKELENDAKAITVDIADGIPENFMGLDIGEKTIKTYGDHILKAKTILWNGPLGVCEIPQFASGTDEITKIIAASTAMKVIGGGDSLAAVKKIGLENNIDHLSTGGGAMLEYIEKSSLPGIEVLTNK